MTPPPACRAGFRLRTARRSASNCSRYGSALGSGWPVVALMRRLLVQLLRGKARIEHGVARLLDERGDIDAHGADQAAAAAHVAAVEQQMLPMLQLIRRHLALQPEQLEQRSERARLALVGLLEGLHLPDRRVLRILGGDVEMTGVRADAAVNAGLEPKGAERADFLRKALHGAGHPSLRGSRFRRARDWQTSAPVASFMRSLLCAPAPRR